MFSWTDQLCRFIKLLFGEKLQSTAAAPNKMLPNREAVRRERLFYRQTSSTAIPTSPNKNLTVSSIYTFVLFDFYGISLQNKQDNSTIKNAVTRSVAKLVLLWMARLCTMASMLFLLITTGQSAFLKDSSAEIMITNQTNTPLPALSSLNLKFYYRLSFHLKSYFCVVSYFYVLIRIKGKLIFVDHYTFH